MANRRLLIVNADDFGQSPGVNRGIIESHERGIVTSASLMVWGEGVVDAVEYARSNPRLSLGLHIDLCEWGTRGGGWWLRYERVPLDDAAAVREEIHRQLAVFRRLVGRDPSHVDSHQHIHRKQPVRAVAAELGRELQVPVRHLNGAVAYCGRFYGQAKGGGSLRESIGARALVKVIAALPGGITELACHPGYAGDLDSDYKEERELEVRALCAPEVRAAARCHNVQLQPFHSADVVDRCLAWRASGKLTRSSTEEA